MSTASCTSLNLSSGVAGEQTLDETSQVPASSMDDVMAQCVFRHELSHASDTDLMCNISPQICSEVGAYDELGDCLDEYGSACGGETEPEYCLDLPTADADAEIAGHLASCMCDKAVHYSTDFSDCLEACVTEASASTALGLDETQSRSRCQTFIDDYQHLTDPGTT